MKKNVLFTISIFFGALSIYSQSTSGFIVSTNFSVGDLIDGEKNPRIVRSLTSVSFQLKYKFVSWDHTVFKMGIGYQNLKEKDSSIDYLIIPIVFERFIKSNKRGFNTGLVLYPSIALGENPTFYKGRTEKFNLQIGVRAGTTFNFGYHKFNAGIELLGPVSTIQSSPTLKYITYGLRVAYYL